MVKKFFISNTKYSETMAEWDWDKNNSIGLDPTRITHGSHKKAHWVCPKNHEYESAIHNKIRGSKCPYCCGKLALVGVNDFKTVCPELFEEVLNKDSVEGILPQSNKKVLWLCGKGHRYLSQVSRRYLGQGCPYCSNQKIFRGFNDLKTTHPHLVSEMVNKYLAEELVYGSERQIEWFCDSGHTWIASIKSRVVGTGCPKCSKNVSGPEKILLKLLGSFDPISQFKTNDFSFVPDIYIPKLNLIIEYDGEYFHKNRVQGDIEKTTKLLEKGFAVCRIRENNLVHLDIIHDNLLQITSKYTKDLRNINQGLVDTVTSWAIQRDIIIT